MKSSLAELQLLLYGGDYSVSLGTYEMPFVSEWAETPYIVSALGSDAVIDELCAVSGPEILAVVERSLRYAGDETHGPPSAAFQSDRFGSLLFTVLAELEREITSATLLARFSLRSGHPYYPVYWDFGFVMAGHPGATVLIGSASD